MRTRFLFFRFIGSQSTFAIELLLKEIAAKAADIKMHKAICIFSILKELLRRLL